MKTGAAALLSPNFLPPASMARGASLIDAAGLSESSRIVPLKCSWQKSAGEEIRGAFPGRGGKLFLLMQDKVKSLNREGECVATFQSEKPVACGEGKDKVYIVCDARKLKTFDLSGNPVGEEREFPKWRLYGGSYEPSAVFCSRPIEDPQGRVLLINFWEQFDEGGCYGSARLLCFGTGDEVESKPLDHFSLHPPVLDSAGNVYIPDSKLLKFSPDLQVSKLEGTSYHLFLASERPYATIGNKLFRLDFAKEQPGAGDELLHWNPDKAPLAPAVGKDGTIHLLLRSTSTRKGFYVKLNPNAPSNHMVAARREIPFKLESHNLHTHPYLTPGGTLYFFGEKVMGKGKNIWPVYAMDPGGSFHLMELAHEPFGFYPGKGEEVVVPMKDGSIVALEAKSLQERVKEGEEAELNQQTLRFFRAGTS